jgi:high-affinity Fe2+/Pb2+ permease
MLSSILGMIVATALAVAVYWISVKDNKKTSHKTH